MDVPARSEGAGGFQTPIVRAIADSGRGESRSLSAAVDAPRKTYLTLIGIAQKLHVSERTAHKIVDEVWFPAPVALFGGSRGHRRWVEQEVDEAIATRAPRITERPPEPAHLREGRSASKKAAAAEASA